MTRRTSKSPPPNSERVKFQARTMNYVGKEPWKTLIFKSREEREKIVVRKVCESQERSSKENEINRGVKYRPKNALQIWYLCH